MSNWQKGFLRSAETGVEYPLAPKVTTIGRDGCDITIKTPNIDFQHAIIEYVDADRSFILQDLNTAQGTYVNNCRIQNAAVRLTAGDTVRFGYAGQTFLFGVLDTSTSNASPVQIRPAWSQTGSNPVEQNSVAPLFAEQSFPSPPEGQLPPTQAQQPNASITGARGSHLAGFGDARPHSATLAGTPLQRPTEGVRRLSLRQMSPSGTSAVETEQLNRLDIGKGFGRAPVGPINRSLWGLPPAGPTPAAQRPGSGSLINASVNNGNSGEEDRGRSASELARLQQIEAECSRKDAIIEQLSRQISQLQAEQGPDAQSSEIQIAANMRRIKELEDELAQRQGEMQGLREQISRSGAPVQQNPLARPPSLQPTPPLIQSRHSSLANGTSSPARASPLAVERVIEIAPVPPVRQSPQNASPAGSERSAKSTSRTYLIGSISQPGKVPSPSLNVTSTLPTAAEPTAAGISAFATIPQNGRGSVNGSGGLSGQNLIQEVELLRKEREDSSKTIGQLQKDVTDRNAHIASLKYEVAQLKKENQEKDVELSAMVAKASRLRDMKQVEEERDARDRELAALRQKFKAAENRIQELLDKLQRTVEDVDAQKAIVSQREADIKRQQLEREQDRGTIEGLRRVERELNAEVEKRGKLHDNLRTRLLQITTTIPGVVVPADEIPDDRLVEMTRKLIEERTNALSQIKQLSETAKDTTVEHTKLLEGIRALQTSIAKANEKLITAGRLARHIKQEIAVMQAHAIDTSMPGASTLTSLRDAVLGLLQTELNWTLDTESQLERAGASVSLTELTHSQHLAAFIAKYEATVSEREALQVRVNSVEDRVLDEMRKLRGQLDEEHRAALRTAVEREQLMAEEKLRAVLQEARNEERSLLEKETATERRKAEDLASMVKELKASLEEQHRAEIQKSVQTEKALSDLKEKREEITKLQAEVASVRAALEEEKQGRLSKKAESETDLASLREQLKELGVTCKSAEQKIKSLTKLTHDYELEISKLRERLGTSERAPPTVSTAEYSKLERAVLALRNENTALTEKLKQHVEVIDALRKDLKGANARLSDMRGELSEEQKLEMEGSRERSKDLEHQLKTLRSELTNLAGTTDDQVVLLNKKDEEISKLKETVSNLESKLSKRHAEFRDLEERAERDTSEKSSKVQQLEIESRMSAELCAAGAQCRGERHLQVIARQREALNELRSRIKVLEQLRPGSKGDPAIAQVVALKKELAELRASRGRENKGVSGAAAAAFSSSGQQESLDAMISPDMLELQLEKQAHLETFATLDASEQCYLALLRSMAGALELETITGNRSMTRLPQEDRQHLMKERDQAIELLCNRIKIFKESIGRKDELLNEHEKTLAKLSQVEDLALKRQNQIEKLLDELRSKAEECELLREYLNKLREQLEQEKRTSATFKKFQSKGDKPMPSSVMTAVSSGLEAGSKTPHLCEPPDVMAKVERNEKDSKDRMKKKDYAIKQLKKDLAERDRKLVDQSTRINALETTLGISSEDLQPQPSQDAGAS